MLHNLKLTCSKQKNKDALFASREKSRVVENRLRIDSLSLNFAKTICLRILRTFKYKISKNRQAQIDLSDSYEKIKGLNFIPLQTHSVTLQQQQQQQCKRQAVHDI